MMETALQIQTSEDLLSVPTLLPEIIFNILVKLPVESLLRCKSVCKLWNSLISDPHFIKSHLNLSTTNSQHHTLLLVPLDDFDVIKSCPLYDVLHGKSINPVVCVSTSDFSDQSFEIVGSCNGLALVAAGRADLFIWNPSTRRSNRVPNSGFQIQLGWRVCYSLGHDVSTDDYKIVTVSYILENKVDAKVNICSLKTGKWKIFGDFPNGMPWDGYGKFCNGAIHWPTSNFRSIASLDLAKETYDEILLPMYDEGDKDLKLGVLGENLCVLCSYYGNRADVWVMKIYGVKNSWSKLVSIPFPSNPYDHEYSMPLSISNDGKLLFEFGSRLIHYDPKNSSFTDIQDIEECVTAYTIVESLVSPYFPNNSRMDI